jgi:hypothetical protein
MRPRKAYEAHKANALHKGIRFLFTFEEWVSWWEHHLGPDWMKKRGVIAGQYCMARKKDKGPYASWNVECKTCQQNSRDQVLNGTSSHGERNGNSKLTKAEVIEIFHDIAARYDTTRSRIYRIKTGRVWTRVTKELLSRGQPPLHSRCPRPTGY